MKKEFSRKIKNEKCLDDDQHLTFEPEYTLQAE